MKKFENIPTLGNDGFKFIMSYYDPFEYSKKNFKDFYIHGLSDSTYKIKMPLPPHRQTVHSIILISKGSITASSGIDDYTVRQDMIIIIPAGQITSLSFMSEDVEGFYLHFSDDYLPYNTIDVADWILCPVIKFQNEEAGYLKSALNRMQKLNAKEENAIGIKAYLNVLLAEIKQSADFHFKINFPAHERITAEFKKLLNYNITKDHSVKFYAQKLNVTPNHLNKSVKSTLGKSASSLIDEMLILEAKVLIQKRIITLSEIAFKIGFEDVSYFGRFFKKHTGFSLSAYRNMIDLSD